MNAYSGNFDLNTITALPTWFGRVVSTTSWQPNIEGSHFDPKEQKGWGYRYRVRYFGLHSARTDELPDEQLPMANVIMPVTGGSGIGGFVDTPALSAGTIVVGFFFDGMSGQEPYIFGALINSNNDIPKQQPKDETGGLQVFGDDYRGTTPQFAYNIPDHLTYTIKPERPPNASTQYKIAQSFPYTLEELRRRTEAREAARPQVGDVVTDAEIRAELEKERYIIENGTLPPTQ